MAVHCIYTPQFTRCTARHGTYISYLYLHSYNKQINKLNNTDICVLNIWTGLAHSHRVTLIVLPYSSVILLVLSLLYIYVYLLFFRLLSLTSIIFFFPQKLILTLTDDFTLYISFHFTLLQFLLMYHTNWTIHKLFVALVNNIPFFIQFSGLACQRTEW